MLFFLVTLRKMKGSGRGLRTVVPCIELNIRDQLIHQNAGGEE